MALHFRLLSASLALLFLLGLATNSWALPHFETPATGHTAVGNGVPALEDPSHQMTLEQVLQTKDRWQPITEQIINMGYTSSKWWFAFELSNHQPGQEWLMEVAYPPLDYLEIYLIRASGAVEKVALGDKLPVSSRPVFHRNFVTPLTLQQDETVQIYVRASSGGSLQVPVSLWEPSSFYAHDISITLMEGLFAGGLLIIALYNLLVYTVLRERYYLYYVGWVGCLLWFVISLNGWAFQFIWPEATHWNDVSINTSLTLACLFGILFTGNFLGIPFWSNNFRLLHYSLALISLCALIAGFFVPYGQIIQLSTIWAIIMCLWGIAGGFIALRKQVDSAQLYLIAWAVMLIGAIVMGMNKVHLLPRNLLTSYTMQVGSLLEVLLLSFALAERINRERQLRHQAQQEALEVQRKANEELEQRVYTRTLELEEANRKLQELSDTDQLTGLKNRRFLNLYLESEFARALRYHHPIAVLMIDVDHFKSVNDTYGHPAGDDCLQEVARRIQREMRWPSDTVSRYGGEEFCVVLPETTLEGAQTVAERIRLKVEEETISAQSHQLSLTVSIGLHVAVPNQAGQAMDFVSRADTALYSAKQHGRNRVVNSKGLDKAS